MRNGNIFKCFNGAKRENLCSEGTLHCEWGTEIHREKKRERERAVTSIPLTSNANGKKSRRGVEWKRRENILKLKW